MKIFKSIIAFIAIALTSCQKEDTVVPYVMVDFTIYVTDPLFIDLNAVGGWMYVSGGSQGILLYRKSIDEVMAFDRHCTYRVSDGCQVQMESNNFTVIDSCCLSRFEINGGTVIQAPATLSLKQYHTSFDGSMLQVYN